MSWQSAEEPEASCRALEAVIVPRPRDIGGFEVRRVLPSAERRSVGPFVFFDQMGPAELAPGSGIDVRPHPHIGLATVTYLFAGTIVHRDSLGKVQSIEPGAVNWMTAGRGIVHSERSDNEHEERAVFLLEGNVEIAGQAFEPGRLLVFSSGDEITVKAISGARMLLFGGEPLDGPRHVWWNFVSSSQARIEQAKADWKAGRFAGVPGDPEFIPLPE
jgi:redox-sensitive bicupin YhaK (pirin superfamily)